MEDTGNKQAAWRMDPSHSGLAGAMGDIGSHAKNLRVTVTGLEVKSICADLAATGAGRTLDDEPTFCCACKAAETRLGAYY